MLPLQRRALRVWRQVRPVPLVEQPVPLVERPVPLVERPVQPAWRLQES